MKIVVPALTHQVEITRPGILRRVVIGDDQDLLDVLDIVNLVNRVLGRGPVHALLDLIPGNSGDGEIVAAVGGLDLGHGREHHVRVPPVAGAHWRVLVSFVAHGGCDFGLFEVDDRRSGVHQYASGRIAYFQPRVHAADLVALQLQRFSHIGLEAASGHFQTIRARRNGYAVIAGAAGGCGPLHAGFDVGDGQRQIGNYTSAGILRGTCDGTEVSLRKGSGSYGRKEA